MAEKGWDATGLIRAVWLQLDGDDKRGQLADASGVRATELSSHNNGKRLGPEVADKIIAGAAKLGVAVSRLELGAPTGDATDQRSKTFLDRLEALEAQGARQARALRDLTKTVRTLETQLAGVQLQQGKGQQARDDQERRS